jgi:hypothetical protein
MNEMTPIGDGLAIRPNKSLKLLHVNGELHDGYVDLSETDPRGELLDDDSEPLVWENYTHYRYDGWDEFFKSEFYKP